MPRTITRLAVIAVVAVTAHTYKPAPGGLDADAAVVTVAGAWEHWRRDLERHRRRPRTISAYRAVWWAWAGFLDGRRRRWDRAGPADLEAFLHRAPIAANTQLHYASALVVAYRSFARTGVLGTDRLAAVVLPRGGAPEVRALTVEQVAHLFACLDSDRWWRDQADNGALGASAPERHRARLVVELAYWCALRAGEIAAARREHVRLRGAVPSLYVPPGKNGRARAVPLMAPVRALLAAELGDGRGGVGPLVCSLRDPAAHVAPQRVSRVGSLVLHAAGVGETLHALRHTAATIMLEADPAALVAISRGLGHSRTTVTEQVYTFGADVGIAAAFGLLPDPRHPAGR